MIARMINNEDEVGFRGTFGRISQDTQDYLTQKVEEYAGRIPDNVRGIPKDFGRELVDSVRAFTDSGLMHKIDSVKRKMKYSWQTDDIRRLNSVEDVQNASPTMQRWMMASPMIRRFKQDGRINGYAETFDDPTASEVRGSDHYEYRRVMDGVYQETVTGEKRFVGYHEVVTTERDLLSLLDKVDILRTWQTAEDELMNGSIDPTSVWNEKIS